MQPPPLWQCLQLYIQALSEADLWLSSLSLPRLKRGINTSHAMAPTLLSLRSKLGFTGKAGVWKFLALIFALLNLKSLPFVWHV